MNFVGSAQIEVMESAMSNRNFVLNPHYLVRVSYGRNLVRAMPDFLLAVFGVRVSSQALAATKEISRSAKAGKFSTDEVQGLAARFDSISPNVASELHMIARSAS